MHEKEQRLSIGEFTSCERRMRADYKKERKTYTGGRELRKKRSLQAG